MSGQTAKSLGWVALLVLVTGVNPALPANPAGADDCRSGPNSPAPAGTHWYYRLDWATQRKCWYVRAQSRRTSLATAPAVGVPASAPHSVLVRFDPIPAPEIVPTSPSPSYNAAAPSVRAEASVLPETSAPVSGRIIDGTARQSALDKSTPPTEEARAVQAGASSETGVRAAAAPSAVSPDPPIAVASPIQTAESAATSPANRADAVFDQAENGAQNGGPNNNAATPITIFPVLALGLALLGMGSRFLIKHAAARRAQTNVGGLERERTNDQGRREARDGLRRQESVVEVQEFHSFVSAVSDEDTLRADGDAVKITRDIGRRRHRLAQLRQNIEWMLRSATGPYASPLQEHR